MNAVQFFKSLADETRLRCVLLIMQQQELCVCELMCALNESQPKISRHLAQLRKSGLLQDRRQGQWVYYAIHQQLPQWARICLDQTLAANTELLSPNCENLQCMDDRPVRDMPRC